MGAEGSCTKRAPEDEPPHGFPAGKVEDYDEKSCKEIWITDEMSVLVTMYEGKFYAMGAKCSHYGAPLGKGVYKDGMIRCPWHGACFDFTSGDIEDFPGIDNLPTYEVKVKHKGHVTVYVNPKHIVTKLMKPMVRMKDQYNRVVIFGAGAAGFMCAQTLRQEGFDGRIIMITKEKYLPYDRPKLTKSIGSEWNQIKLRDKTFYEDHDIEVMMDTHIGRIDLSGHKLYLESNDYNEFLSYEKIVLCCGLKPRMYAPNVKGHDLKNITKCSTLEDSLFISKMVTGKKVLLIGSSFVAMELASSIKDKVASLAILSRHKAPYGVVFGETTGKALLKYFLSKAKKCTFYAVDEVKYFEGNAKNEVTAVVTIKKKVIPCDFVVVAIGGVPNTDVFEKDSLKIHEKEGTIITNKYLETNYKHTYAAGDVANFPLRIGARDRVTIGHWQVALTHGKVCALNIMKKGVSIQDIIPFFWTSLCGLNIRYTGYGEAYDDTLIFGDLEKMEFCTIYLRLKKVIALCAVGCDPIATQMASAFEDQATWPSEIPDFITERFPEPPLSADAMTGYRPKDDETNNFDLKAANLSPRRVPEKPPTSESMDLLENFLDVTDDPVLPTVRERLMELKREQRDRKKRREQQRGVDAAKSKQNVTKWEDAQASHKKAQQARYAADRKAAAANPKTVTTTLPPNANNKAEQPAATVQKPSNLKKPGSAMKKSSAQKTATVLPPNMRTNVPAMVQPKSSDRKR